MRELWTSGILNDRLRHLSLKISDTLVVLHICFKSGRKAVHNFKFDLS